MQMVSILLRGHFELCDKNLMVMNRHNGSDLVSKIERGEIDGATKAWLWKSSWQEIDLFKGLVLCFRLHHRDGLERIENIKSVAIITT